MVEDPGAAALYCTACGRPLGLFTEDQPDWATGPLCGECYRNHEWEEEAAFDLLYEEDEQPW